MKQSKTKGARVKLLGLENEAHIVLSCLERKLPVLLVGETGMGKTYLCRALAQDLGVNLVRVTLTKEVSLNELYGKWLLHNGTTVWQDGVLTAAMRNGHWLLVDEMNMGLPEVLSCLNSVMDDSHSITLAEKDNEVVEAHDKFRVIATMNPSQDYAGTQDVNKALMSRFTAVVEFPNYKPETEAEILKLHTGIDDLLAAIMVDCGNGIRGLKATNQISYPCSTRDLVHWANLSSLKGLSLQEAFEYAICNKADADERDVIKTAAKATPKVEFNWKSKASTVVRNLTEKFAKDIEGLEARRKKLQDIVSQMESEISSSITALKGEAGYA